ncbi:UDP glucose-4-epimerase [Scheffersomyces xylosifermentans]|uniref:UDP glucose-4-epimerase n=1 Tax=Scheffersomyces xylosifermentans TaxID=1304137 RepID=UPI00315CBA6D
MSSQQEYILVTGGAGYIGSHTVVELVNSGQNVVIVDSLVNSSYDAVARVEFLTQTAIPFFDIDIRDSEKLSEVFKQYKIKGVVHFASLKAVGESTQIPLSYYDNNVNGTISLLNVMKENKVKSIVFSSSATVYGDVTRFGDNSMIPIPENCPSDPTNPYGRSKFMIESILKDIHSSDESNWKVAILRYFNPIGAHPSGLIGEDPLGTPNNLLPYLAQVAIGRREKLSIFGNDYASHDGTPIRDYIHVVDLAKGHIAALGYLAKNTGGLYREWNLGTGKGSTVFDVYHAFSKAVGKELPYEVVARRAGDVLDLTANPARANKELEWKAELSIEQACADLWKWTVQNPTGFKVEGYEWKKFEKVGLENRLHSFTNGPLTIALANRGALIQDLSFNGEHLVNAFDNGEDYKLPTNPYFGTNIGRVANRIANAEFQLNGKTYHLPKNENQNSLHGGSLGFDKVNWLGPIVRKKEGVFTVEFLIVEKDGTNGYPGDLKTIIKYTIDSSSVQLEYEAELINDKVDATIVNLTNHSYFNLSGEPTTDDTDVTLFYDQYMKVDDVSLLPTGDIVKFEGVTVGQPIHLDKDAFFDYCYIVDKDATQIDTRGNELKPVLQATHPRTTTKFVFSTTEPSFQFYTGDGVNTKGFTKRSGFCVEPARFVNAIHFDKWASQVILKKGEKWGGITKYSFSKK